MSEDVASSTSSSNGFLTSAVSEKDFAKLRTAIKLRWFEGLSRWYIEDRFTYPLRRFLARNRFTYSAVNFFLDAIRAKILDLKKIDDGYERSLGLLMSNQEDGYSVDSQFGYRQPEIDELSTLLNYKKQIDDGFPGQSESKQLYAHIVDTASHVLRETGAKVFVNFGVSYAYTDHLLAKKFPDVRFFGIERTMLPKLVNEVFFSSQRNMTFLAGDVFEYFRANRFEGGVFHHSRTLLLLPSSFIRKLYKAVKEAGFSYIYGTEQYGISRQTGKNFDFSFEHRDSVVYRDFMYIHNYPEILKDNGFDLVLINSIKTDHPHEDYRVFSFVAKSATDFNAR